MLIKLNDDWKESFSSQDLNEMNKIVITDVIPGSHPQWVLKTQHLLLISLSSEGVVALVDVVMDAGR